MNATEFPKRGVCDSATWGRRTHKKESCSGLGRSFVLSHWPVAIGLVVVLALLLITPAAAAKKSGKVTPQLEQMLASADPATVVDVIVQYKGKAQPKHVANVRGQGGKKAE